MAVYHVIRGIMTSTAAPKEDIAQLRYGKASIMSEYETSDGRRIKICAGMKIMTDPQLYHTRPDIVIVSDRPKKVWVFEVAISHLQNVKVQERVKRARYAVNSTVHVTHTNYDSVPRSFNLVEALGKIYKCPVTLCILVIGTFGKVIETEEYKKTTSELGKIGMKPSAVNALMQKCSLNTCECSAKLIIKRIGAPTE